MKTITLDQLEAALRLFLQENGSSIQQFLILLAMKRIDAPCFAAQIRPDNVSIQAFSNQLQKLEQLDFVDKRSDYGSWPKWKLAEKSVTFFQEAGF